LAAGASEPEGHLSTGRYQSVKKYECAVVVAPTVGSDVLESCTKKYTDVITSRGGSLTGIDDWGKRSLAYEIEDHREGYYHFYRFVGSRDIVDELDRQLKIDENVIRHMIVRDERRGKAPAARTGETPEPPTAKEGE
jgi:small subunit ribosomal protein S6